MTCRLTSTVIASDGFPSPRDIPRRKRWIAAMLWRVALVVGSVGWLVVWPAAAGASGSATSSTSTAPPSNKNEVTFGIAPSNTSRPDGRGYFGFSATPGATLTDHLAISDYAYQPLTLQLYATDAVNTRDGSFALLPPNKPSPRFAGWISLPPSDRTITVPARGTVVIPFQLHVPTTATPGDHVGGVLATLQSMVTSPSGQRINLLQSVGTRIFVRVSGPLHPGLAVTSLKARYEGTTSPFGSGRVVLTYIVRNSGNVGLGGKQTVWVSGLFGSKTSARTVASVPLLLPGYSVRESVTLPSVIPELHMTGHVSISPLVIPGSQQPPSGPYKGVVSFWAVPWTLTAIAGTVMVMIVGLLVLRRRRRGRPPLPMSTIPSDEVTVS